MTTTPREQRESIHDLIESMIARLANYLSERALESELRAAQGCTDWSEANDRVQRAIADTTARGVGPQLALRYWKWRRQLGRGLSLRTIEHQACRIFSDEDGGVDEVSADNCSPGCIAWLAVDRKVTIGELADFAEAISVDPSDITVEPAGDVDLVISIGGES